MLDFINVTGFKKLENFSAEFSDGLNIVCGENAAGKTTLTAAISFALFGVRAVNGSADLIPTWGKKDCEVELGCGRFRIVRTLKNCSVYKDGTLEATGNSVSSAYIEENLVGVDLKTFKLLNWSEQGETGAILTMGATQLQRDVESLAGVDFLDKIIAAASADVNKAKAQLAGVGEEATLEELTSQKEEEEAVLDRALKQASIANRQIAAVSEEISQKGFQVKDMVNASREAAKAVKRKEFLTASILAEDRSVAKDQEAIDEIELEIKKLPSEGYEEYSERKKQVDLQVSVNSHRESAEDSLKALHKKLEGMEENIFLDRQLEVSLKAAEDSLRKASSEVEKAHSSASEQAVKVVGLKEAIKSGVCSQCGQTVVDENTLAAHKEELKKAELTLKKIKERVEDKESEERQATLLANKAKREKKDGYRGWEVTQEVWKEDIAKHQDFLDSSKFYPDTEKELLRLAEIASAQDLLASLNSRARKYSHSIKTSKEERARLHREMEKVNSQIIDITEDSVIDSLNTELENLAKDKDELYEKKSSIEGMVSDSKTLIRTLQARAERAQLAKGYSDQIAGVGNLVSYLKSSRVAFLNSMWAAILGAASGFLAQATNGSISALKKTDKDGFVFCEEGTYAPVSVASGAQKGFLGVAIRLALAKSLRSSFPVVILDEPTESMREENALRLSGALLGHGQVLMVTHRESDSISASNVIQVG